MNTMYSDRTLTSTGQELLRILQSAPSTAEQIGVKVPYPIYRVRTGLIELEGEKLISVQEGRYQLTDAGLKRIAEFE